MNHPICSTCTFRQHMRRWLLVVMTTQMLTTRITRKWIKRMGVKAVVVPPKSQGIRHPVAHPCPQLPLSLLQCHLQQHHQLWLSLPTVLGFPSVIFDCSPISKHAQSIFRLFTRSPISFALFLSQVLSHLHRRRAPPAKMLSFWTCRKSWRRPRSSCQRRGLSVRGKCISVLQIYTCQLFTVCSCHFFLLSPVNMKPVKNAGHCAVKIAFPCLYLESLFSLGMIHKREYLPNAPNSWCASMRIREKKLLMNQQLQRLKSQPLDITANHTPPGESRDTYIEICT